MTVWRVLALLMLCAAPVCAQQTAPDVDKDGKGKSAPKTQTVPAEKGGLKAYPTQPPIGTTEADSLGKRRPKRAKK